MSELKMSLFCNKCLLMGKSVNVLKFNFTGAHSREIMKLSLLSAVCQGGDIKDFFIENVLN